MTAIITQDVFGIPVGVGAQCSVFGKVSSFTGTSPSLAITVAAQNNGNLGDTTNTIVVGQKQVIGKNENGGPGVAAYVINNDQVSDLTSRFVSVLGTVTSISGSGATAQITVTALNRGNLGDTRNTIVVGQKQLSANKGDYGGTGYFHFD